PAAADIVNLRYKSCSEMEGQDQLPAQAEVARRVRENELRQLAFQRELLSRPEKKHSNNVKPIFIANKTTC
ncbi:hypothetical protein NX024_20140, partial [Escherichia coli]|nr:hypothetical protein [Escherichia coli]